MRLKLWYLQEVIRTILHIQVDSFSHIQPEYSKTHLRQLTRHLTGMMGCARHIPLIRLDCMQSLHCSRNASVRGVARSSSSSSPSFHKIVCQALKNSLYWYWNTKSLTLSRFRYLKSEQKLIANDEDSAPSEERAGTRGVFSRLQSLFHRDPNKAIDAKLNKRGATQALSKLKSIVGLTGKSPAKVTPEKLKTLETYARITPTNRTR
ncbi:hypothetical protein GQ600_26744 [Phytophthora cactorum]|nr:hypothetical protein GQ600_26744 [Phytophthora cactorum]